MHRLVTAENFDETLCAHRQKKWRMSKLLVRLNGKSPQPNVSPVNAGAASGFNEKHQQRMEQLRDVTQWQKSHR